MLFRRDGAFSVEKVHYPSGWCVFRGSGALTVGVVRIPSEWCTNRRDGAFTVVVVRFLSARLRSQYCKTPPKAKSWINEQLKLQRSRELRILIAGDFWNLERPPPQSAKLG